MTRISTFFLRRNFWVGLAGMALISGCATLDGKQRSAWNPITGGYSITEVAPHVHLIYSKSAPYIPKDYPELPGAHLISSILGGRHEDARKHWPELAAEACSGGGYREYDSSEYESHYSDMPYQVIAVKAAYAICNQGNYSDEALIKLLKP